MSETAVAPDWIKELYFSKEISCHAREMELTGNFIEAYRQLGGFRRKEIEHQAKRMRDAYPQAEEIGRDDIALMELKIMKLKSSPEEEDRAIAGGLIDYMAALTAFAQGARIDLNTAMAMQVELGVGGCQTGVKRETNGSVSFFHTEEDFEGYRITDTVMGKFPDGSVSYTSYPEILPGAAFSITRTGKLIMVDSLFTKEIDQPAIPAGVVPWLAWHLDGQVSTDQIAQKVSGFSGGYAVTEIWCEGGKTQVKTTEYANSAAPAVIEGPHKSDGWKIHDNTMSSTSPETLSEEDMDGEYEYFDKLWKTHTSIQPDATVSQVLSHRLPGEEKPDYGGSVQNTFTFATVHGNMSGEGFEINVLGGPFVSSELSPPELTYSTKPSTITAWY